MITEQDLREAIAECEGARDPNANTCVKLAAFYTIRDHLFPKTEVIDPPTFTHSFESSPVAFYGSETEFAKNIKGIDTNVVLGLFDELMTALKILYPRLYDATMDKLLDRRG